MKYGLTIIIVCISSLILKGQDEEGIVQDSTDKKSSFTSIFYGEPGKAALYSLILPSGGQFYNKRYWKIPLVLGAEGYAIYNVSNSIRSFQRSNNCWMSTISSPDNLHPDCSFDFANPSSAITSTAFRIRQSRRSRKEQAWIIFGAVHLMNVVEAFVDRHLINFDTSEDISYHNLPSPDLQIDKNDMYSFSIIRARISLNSNRQ